MPVAAVVGDFHAARMAKVLFGLGHESAALAPDPGDYGGEEDFARYLRAVQGDS